MKCARLWVMAAVAAVLMWSGARAETEAEYLHPGAPRKQASPFPRPAQQPVVPKPRASSPAMFAPGAALNSKRMSDQQREEIRFLKDAAAAGRFEMEASRHALAKSNKPGIRSFATMLINHHTSVSNELVHLLHVRGLAPPMLANDQRKTLNRLARLQGAKFDREFIDEIGLKRQQENLQLYERARMGAGDPQLRAWIDRMLPKLRNHVMTAERLAPADPKHLRAAPAANAEPSRRSARSG